MVSDGVVGISFKNESHYEISGLLANFPVNCLQILIEVASDSI